MNQLHLECDCPTCKDAATDEQLQIQRLMTGVVPSLPGVGHRAAAGGESTASSCSCSSGGRRNRSLDGRRLPPAAASSAGPLRWSSRPCWFRPRRLRRECHFMLFAGKGGVGKTTLSCVTAVRMARDFPDKRVVPRHNSIRGQNGSDEWNQNLALQYFSIREGFSVTRETYGNGPELNATSQRARLSPGFRQLSKKSSQRKLRRPDRNDDASRQILAWIRLCNLG